MPYLAPKLPDAPRMLPTTEHSVSCGRWGAFSRQARPARELGTQSFSMYRLRFWLAAERSKAVGNFGILSRHISHFATSPNLATVACPGVAISYRKILAAKIQRRARRRSEQLSDFAAMIKAGDFPTKEQPVREIATAIEKTNATCVTPVKSEIESSKTR